MGMLIVPLLILVTISSNNQKTPDHVLADFSRLAKAQGVEVSLVDRDGTVREGVLASATADQLTMQFGAGQKTFARAEVAAAERLRDGRKDGFIKGAIFGAITGVFAAQGLDSIEQGIAGWLGSVAVYGAIGYALDAAQTHREPIYRARGTPAPPPPVKVSLRF
jgi:hypothetical protein